MKITVSHDLVGWFYCPRCGIEYCTDGDDYDFLSIFVVLVRSLTLN